MRILRWAIVVTAVSGTCAASASSAPVSLVGSPPALLTGRPWSATLRVTGNGTRALSASNGRRSLRFRARRIRAHRFRARVVIPSPGRWLLVARLRRQSFRLATLRVTAQYRFEEPGQVLATPDGSLLVAERGSRGRITLVNPQTGKVGVFASGLRQPYGLAFAADRTVLVSTAGGIFRVPPHGGTPARIVTAQVGPILPQDGTLFYGRPDEIGRLDLSTGRASPFGPAVTAPHSLVLAADGRLLVPDSTAGRILAVDPASGSSATVAEGMRTPLGMIADPGGAALVVEYGAGTLARIGPGGSKTTIASGFRKPYSLAIGRDANTYVVEAGELGSATTRLERVTPAGRVSPVRLHG